MASATPTATPMYTLLSTCAKPSRLLSLKGQSLYSYHQDPDWLSDIDDHNENPAQYDELWSLFRDLELGKDIPQAALRPFEYKLARCQRLQAKSEGIYEECIARQTEELKQMKFFENSGNLGKEELDRIHAENTQKILVAFRKK